MRKLVLGLVALAFVLGAGSVARANLIGNPSFVSTAGSGGHTQGGGVNDWAGLTRWYNGAMAGRRGVQS